MNISSSGINISTIPTQVKKSVETIRERTKNWFSSEIISVKNTPISLNEKFKIGKDSPIEFALPQKIKEFFHPKDKNTLNKTLITVKNITDTNNTCKKNISEEVASKMTTAFMRKHIANQSYDYNYRVTSADLLSGGVSISANNRLTVSEGKRELTSPDANTLSSIQSAVSHSTEGAQVAVGNRTYSVVELNNHFHVSQESGDNCLMNFLYRPGWPKGEVTRKIELVMNTPRHEINPVKNKTILDKTPIQDEMPPIPQVDYNATLHKGEIVGKGGDAIVYADKDDETKVLKMFTIPQLHEEVVHEVECFNTYYGKGSAEIIYNNNDISGIKMTRIQGEPVIYAENLPPHAEQAIYDMFDRLERNNILFVDTTETNVLYDRDTNRFNPIDISSYNLKHTDSKDRQDSIIESYICGKSYLINTVLNKIE